LITDSDNLREKVMSFYKEELDQINSVLKEFLSLSESKCILLIDKDGLLVTKVGEAKDFDLQAVAALCAGSYHATRQVARLIGEDEFYVLFNEGNKDSIQLSLVGDRTLLATVFDDTTTLGMVRLYSKEASDKLSKIIDSLHSKRSKVVV
jgi:predicted regulator of Ras-like GTPase activity (Roadblock/LC7/MglB family)